MKRVGVLYHPLKEDAYFLAQEIGKSVSSRGISVWLCSAWDSNKIMAEVDGCDLIISIGGDGTILRSAQAAVVSGAPITGINLGKLGFMTELSADEAIVKLPDLLSGKGWIDERAMLEAELSVTDKAPELPGIFYALNDVVIARGTTVRMINVEATIDNELLTSYRCDGVIVATATGSTGYSLAAAGPILYPQSKDFLLLPIVPHLSSSYTLVVPSTSVVRLRVSTATPATLSIDGHINLPVSSGAVITVRRSAKTVRFLRMRSPNSFYSYLEQRLKGKH